MHCKWKRSNADYIEFKKLRAMCIRLSRVKYKNYIAAIASNIKKNIRSFWSYVKSCKRELNIPCNTFWDTSVAINELGTTNLFSSFFASVYVDNSINEVPLIDTITDILSDFRLSKQYLHTLVSNLKDKANPGPDEIPSLFIKKCSPAIKDEY